MPDRYTHITDEQLLNNFYNDRDNQWLGILFERYTLLLFGVAMKYLKNEEEAKDAVQHVFLKAITELNKYPVQFFKSWLYMIIKNHCLIKIRQRQDKISTSINEQQIPDDSDPAALHQHIEKDRKLELMSSSLDELNREQKQCVTLFYLEKKSYQQIAEETGYTVMQVKSYIQNGKRNLKVMLQKKISNK
ncbi:MAG TPA: sigma-70 family RNA polymerase sigma factor [Flavitalea sp.]|nr:sigma-70 family RNA polymerase sigma factor [Flavitalea sp.]